MNVQATRVTRGKFSARRREIRLSATMRFEQTVHHMCVIWSIGSLVDVLIWLLGGAAEISRELRPCVPDGTIVIARAVHLTKCIIDICSELALLLRELNRGKRKPSNLRASKDWDVPAISGAC